MQISNYAVFILTHGRPKKVYTVASLAKGNYTGPVYLVVDDQDSTVDEYRKIYGERVIVFDKKKAAAETDTCDNFQDLRAVVYARNACFQIAKDLGFKYFLVLDDDYMTFLYKFDASLVYGERRVLSLDKVFPLVFNFLAESGANCVALAQNGDFIGGGAGAFGKAISLRRKCMNTFFCDVDRPFSFKGLVNEDVCLYVGDGSRGLLYFTINQLAIAQKLTQSNSGGLTTIYLDQGTYVKSFYSVIVAPSCVTIGMMGENHRRLHHRIEWDNCVPKILAEDCRKTR